MAPVDPNEAFRFHFCPKSVERGWVMAPLATHQAPPGSSGDLLLMVIVIDHGGVNFGRTKRDNGEPLLPAPSRDRDNPSRSWPRACAGAPPGVRLPFSLTMCG